MNKIIQEIRSHISQSTPNFGGWDIHSLLELLYQIYTEYNPINTVTIRDLFRSLEQPFSKLPPPQKLTRYLTASVNFAAHMSKQPFWKGSMWAHD